MLAALKEFQERISQLHQYLDSSQAIEAITNISISYPEKNDLITSLTPHINLIKKGSTIRRVHLYASFIVLLYGLFEQFVEDLLIAYLNELEKHIARFDDMPEKIKQSHTELSAQLLLNSQLDKYRERCNPAQIVDRMKLCLNKQNYSLNTLAFIDHKSNFRIDSINNFFNVVGISGISGLIKITKEFQEYAKKRFPEGGIENLPDNVVYDDLNDLAWRRNVVAHSWPDDTIAVEMMIERLEFIGIFGKALFSVVRQNLLPVMVKHRGQKLPEPIKIYNHEIVCFHIENQLITRGDTIICRNNEDKYYEGRIDEIEVDHEQLNEVSAPPAIDVACRLNFRAKENWDYYLIKS